MVLDSQFQRRIDVPFLLIAPHVDVVLTGSAICNPVNEPWVRMEVEDDWLVRCEDRLELPIRQTMGMLGAGNQPEKIVRRLSFRRRELTQTLLIVCSWFRVPSDRL